MGRGRDRGSERWATVAEASEALGVTNQAIYNRIKAQTIPYEEHVDEATGRPSYRIDREWLTREVERRQREAATPVEVHQTVEELNRAGIREILQTVRVMLSETAVESDERIIEALGQEIVRNRESISSAVARQEANFIASVDALSAELQRQGSARGAQYEEMKKAQLEVYRLLERVVGRFEEEAEREREYQQKNYELNTELRDLAREARRENAQARSGQLERRENLVSKRFVYWCAAIIIALAVLAVALTLVDIFVHVT